MQLSFLLAIAYVVEMQLNETSPNQIEYSEQLCCHLSDSGAI